MNFLPGTLRVDGAVTLAGAHGELALSAASVPPAWNGRAIVLGVRPEAVHPVASPADGAVEARLEVIEPVGNEVFLNLRVGDQPLVLRTPPRDLPAPGSLMHVAPDPQHLHFFDADTGARLSR
jgi:multiple sugar transport system ATP-binding protein